MKARTAAGISLADLSQQHPVLLICLRHSGCTSSREALADLSVARANIEKTGAKLVVVHMGTAASFAALTVGYELGDVPAISDPELWIYRGLGLRGDGTRMPGVFLIQRGRIVRRFIHANAADRPDYASLAQLPA